MRGIIVNPAAVREGDRLATKFFEASNGDVTVNKSVVIKRVQPCAGKPENVHLDHRCYDTRFSTVVIAEGK